MNSVRPYRDMSVDDLEKAIQKTEEEIEFAKDILKVMPKDLCLLCEEKNRRIQEEQEAVAHPL